MLTKPTEEEWGLAVALFRAARSRRGDTGRDGRKFLEALHYFTVHNIAWRALPAAFGNWNSVWKRFWRLSRGGVFGAFFQLLAERSGTCWRSGAERDGASRPDVRQHGGAGACLGGRRQRGQDGRALGRSRGGFSTKIHRKTDCEGLPLDFHPTGGQASDSRQFETLLDIGPDLKPRAAMADKGYDAKANRQAARKRAICPVIPYRSNTKDRPALFPKALYRTRARIEQTMGKLKRFKRLALRCEKTAQNYTARVAFACRLILIKSVHTA